MINRVPRLKARIVGGSTSSVKKIVSVVATLDMRSRAEAQQICRRTTFAQ